MDLVSQRPHVPGISEPRSFEDALRDLLHDSPFFFLSAVFHAVLLLLFAVAPDELPRDPERIIRGTLPDIVEPPPPPPPPPPPVLDEPPTIIETPDITTTPVETPLASNDPFDTPFASQGPETNVETPLGVGPGDLGGGGPGPKYIQRRNLQGPETVNVAVANALEWLARHQNPDGSWSCGGFDAMCEGAPACDGLGSPEFDVGVTGLALLAFLGAGETPRRGEHSDVVRKGLLYLKDVQGADGNFGNPRLSRHTYDHVLATLAMIEAYGLTGGDRIFRGPAEAGLKHLYRTRQPGGAWRYADFHPDMVLAPNDVSVTGWAIMAMTSARDSGLHVDAVALEDALLFLDEMTDPVTGVTGYTSRGGRPARMEGVMTERWPHDESESMTGVAVLCRIFADETLQRPGARELVDKGAAVISRVKPLWSDDRPGRRDYYSWYYGSYALYQVGGKPWRDWEVTLVPAIANQQRNEGEQLGSWDPQHDPWGGEGGRVYSTAILALTMEVFSRYPTVMGSH
ncbi:MAG: prenyltransferase/squalene oxidase repeat-containing protein [Planctomycetota bacterium]